MATDASIMSLTRRPFLSAARFSKWCTLLLAVVVSGSAMARNPFAEYDMMMFQRPEFPVTSDLETFSPKLKPLWTKALHRSEDTELRRMAIDTLAIAHRKGMSGLEDLKPELVKILDDPQSHREVVRAAANTLIEFDAQDQAELLAKVALQRQATIAQLIEPALAKWQSPAMEQAWIDRLKAHNSNPVMLLLAIDGLGALRSMPASEELETIVNNQRASASVRLAAAKALSAIRPSGLTEMARTLIEQPSHPDSLGALLAIALLGSHSDQQAVEILAGLLGHSSTAVHANAIQRLFEIDADLVHPHLDELITSPDVNVRRVCVQAMIAQPKVERISLLAKSLDDVNPTLRREVAAGLLQLAEQAKLRDQVIESTTAVLNENSWRGCEQATVVLSRLDHEPAGRRLVELLQHERPEVKVAAAWGLSQLRIKELLPDMLEYAQSVSKSDLGQVSNGLAEQISHLFMAFGDQDYQPADEHLRTFIPKLSTLGLHSRPAAIWALGLLHEGKLDEGLMKQMVDRLADVKSLEPEEEYVRQMCAISLGRMGAKQAVADLREFSGTGSFPARACAWAIEKLTGEKAPPMPAPATVEVEGWFLSPLPKS